MASFECKDKQFVELNQSNGVSRILLNDPHKKNALSKGMIQCLLHMLEQIAHDDKQKLVILRGAGGAFCSGADLNWMKKGLTQTKEENEQDAGLFYDLFTRLFNYPKPIIAWVEKFAMGGALGLLACADYVIADNQTKMAFSEVKLGLVPATIAPFVIKKIGFAHSKALLLSGVTFSSKHARKIGLVNEVLPSKAIPQRVQELVNQLKRNGTEAMTITKQLLNSLADRHHTLQEAKLMCCEKIATSRASEEGQEGVSAFFDKRTPSWYK